jgi:hypothetical protein
MNSNETILTLCNPVDKYKGYSVFEIDFNGYKINVMTLKDIKFFVSNMKEDHEKEIRDFKEKIEKIKKVWFNDAIKFPSHYTNEQRNIIKKAFNRELDEVFER